MIENDRNDVFDVNEKTQSIILCIRWREYFKSIAEMNINIILK